MLKCQFAFVWYLSFVTIFENFIAFILMSESDLPLENFSLLCVTFHLLVKLHIFVEFPRNSTPSRLLIQSFQEIAFKMPIEIFVINSLEFPTQNLFHINLSSRLTIYRWKLFELLGISIEFHSKIPFTPKISSQFMFNIGRRKVYWKLKNNKTVLLKYNWLLNENWRQRVKGLPFD